MRMRRSARKLGVGVERDDETDLRENGKIADLDREAVVLSAQKFVQVEQLAALAFPAHPSLLARVVDAVAVQQKKRSLLVVGILLVQFRISDEHSSISGLSSLAR